MKTCFRLKRINKNLTNIVEKFSKLIESEIPQGSHCELQIDSAEPHQRAYSVQIRLFAFGHFIKFTKKSTHLLDALQDIHHLLRRKIRSLQDKRRKHHGTKISSLPFFTEDPPEELALQQ